MLIQSPDSDHIGRGRDEWQATTTKWQQSSCANAQGYHAICPVGPDPPKMVRISRRKHGSAFPEAKP
jgi:hypothetical protein